MLRRIRGSVALFDLFSCEAKYVPHAAMCTPDLWREKLHCCGNEDQVKKQAALDGAHVESFDRLCEVINKTADVTNYCKVVKLSDVFCKLQSIREVKLKKKLENCEADKGHLGSYPFGQAGRFVSFLIVIIGGGQWAYRTNTAISLELKLDWLIDNGVY